MARPPKKERGLYTWKDASGKLWGYYRVYLNGREQRGGCGPSRWIVAISVAALASPDRMCGLSLRGRGRLPVWGASSAWCHLRAPRPSPVLSMPLAGLSACFRPMY